MAAGLWLCLLLLCAKIQVSLYRCVHDQVQSRVRVVRAIPDRNLGEVAPMRIGFWLSGESDHLSEQEEARVKATVEQAGRTVSSLLSGKARTHSYLTEKAYHSGFIVKRTSNPLLLRRDVDKYCKFLWKNPNSINYNRCGRANKNYIHETCLDVKIPDEHLAGVKVHPQANSTHRLVLRHPGAGAPNVDFLLYVHVRATDKCRAQPSLLAYAAHCQTDSRGRPLAGVVAICRERLTRLTVQTVVHELLHVLGFSKDLFPTWRDCSFERGFSASVACSPRGKVTHSDGQGQTRIYTPSVISTLQRHLAAFDPELGGPLENSDATPGGVSSHWESRFLQSSIMLAAASQDIVARIDPLTLAAFQDTGWYAVNTHRAQNLVWGDGEGALFGSTLTCQDNSSSFFCTGSGLGCHHLHLQKGECQTDPFLDGCRIYKAFENGSECWKKENEKKSSEERLSGEVFGSDSRCFFSDLTTLNLSLFNRIVTGRCYRRKCTGTNRYQVQVRGSDWVDCPAGGSIQIRGYQGSVFCPNKRLCVDSDVTPSIEADIFNTEQPETTWSEHRLTANLLPTIVLCVLAGLGFLVVLGLASSKCSVWKVRIHAASADV
ncbi:ciliated left-right organizer metallopeptidase [Corythoichthys intestinalis]|uniref:ciliated left-right organizer metallopeptidase n=1 Tax=Corythoichthys intestinalis TaxID=161448 RepID=UPI0025A5A8F3|nr:ciliated left-right organizer metallopeptidase [Corythoichthys intestinalis]